MYTFDITNVLNTIITVSLYFTVATLGSFTTDLYNSLSRKDRKIRVNRILIGSIFATFIMIGIERYIIAQYSINTLIFLGYIFGGVGFELFGRWVNADIIYNVVVSRFTKK